MKLLFPLLLFFICLNLATTIINALNTLPLTTSPYASPEGFLGFLTLPTSAFGIITFGFTIIGVIAGILARNPYITGAALLVFAIDRLLPFGGYVVGGFPTYLETLGVPTILSTSLQVLFYFVFFMGIMELLTGRETTT